MALSEGTTALFVAKIIAISSGTPWRIYVEDVLKQRSLVENELQELKRQFLDKARTARSFRVQVESMESLAALSRGRHIELMELRKRIDENEADLREIQRITAERKAEYDRLGKLIRKRRAEKMQVNS